MTPWALTLLMLLVGIACFPLWGWLRERQDLQRVRRDFERPAEQEVFREALIEGLPSAAQRYFRHAIAEGTPLASRVDLRYRQRVKRHKTDPNSPFNLFELEETLVPKAGFLARGWVRIGGWRKPTALRYIRGEAAIFERRLGGLLTLVVKGHNANEILRTRMLSSLFFSPAALLPGEEAVWEDLGTDDRARVTVGRGEQTLTMDFQVDPDGRLLEVSTSRWGSVGTVGGRFELIPFGLQMTGEATFGGMTIPVEMTSGWWFGTDRYLESILISVDEATFR